MFTRFASVFALLILFSSLSFAQNKTIFGDGEDSFGGFGGPSVHFTQVKGELGVMPGGYGALLINHQLGIGAGGYGLANDIEYDRSVIRDELGNRIGERRSYINFGYGGGYLEFTFFPKEPVHFNISALIGAGGVGFREYGSLDDLFDNDYYEDYYDDDRHDYIEDTFFVLEPGVNVQMNLTQWFRVSIGASYRYIDGVNQIENLSDKDFRNFSGNIDFKFGWF